MGASPLDVPGVGVQPVDEVAVARAEGGGPFAVAAAKMHDESASDSRGVEGLLREGFLVGGGPACAQGRLHPRTQQADQQYCGGHEGHNASFLAHHHLLPGWMAAPVSGHTLSERLRKTVSG